ncbi:hypothetical protein R1sor_027303 [Riccia sorocarpa]|uniref:CCHC-type domain-containing protein n=1 Tax=Riccia sorocarpa TaxID=122646 RepID=A0ABD3GDV1_9MARC
MAAMAEIHSSAGERKRNSARRLSLLTRSGEALGWGKRVCHLEQVEERQMPEDGDDMTEPTGPTSPTGVANDWSGAGITMPSTVTSQLLANAHNTPHNQHWWEEMMRAEAARNANKWHSSQQAPLPNPVLHNFISQGSPMLSMPFPLLRTNPIHHLSQQGGSYGSGSQLPVAANPPYATQASQQNGEPTAATARANLTQTRALPSLRDIMAKQSQQKQSPTGVRTSSQGPTTNPQPRTYATTAGPGTTPGNKQSRPVLSREEIRKRVAGILEIIPKPMERTEPSRILKYKLTDTAAEEFGRKTLDLEARGVILYTGGINPLRDTMAKWIQDQLITKLKVNATQLRVLDRSHYLVLLASEEERAKLFNAGPQYLNGRFVEIIPWTADYDTTTLTKKRKPAWVSIAGLSPSLENEGRKMLEKLGKVLHMSGVDQHGRSKFSDVRGMVLLQVDEDHPEAIEIEYEGGTAEFQLYYEFLPEGCYVCHEVGHVARFCPQTTTTREVSKEDLEEAIRQADEQRKEKEARQPPANNSQPNLATGQGAGSTASTKTPLSNPQKAPGTPPELATKNPYEVLLDEDDEMDSGTEEDIAAEDETPQTVRLSSPVKQTPAQPTLDLNVEAESRKTDPHPADSSHGNQRDSNEQSQEMEVNTAQKRGTYGNVSQEETLDDGSSGRHIQGKKIRAVADPAASVNQVMGEISPTSKLPPNTQLGAIQGRHWEPVAPTAETVDCQDSQPSGAEKDHLQKRGKGRYTIVEASQSNATSENQKGQRIKDGARSKAKGGKK